MTMSRAKGIRLAAGIITTVLFLTQTIARADAVLDWNTVMQSTVGRSAAISPGALRRDHAISSFRSGERNHTRNTSRTSARSPRHADASAEAAAIAAAHTVLKAYFPDNAATLDAARASSLAMIPDGSAKSSGIATGEMAAAAVMAARSDDGSTPPAFYMPASSGPGEWQPTPGCTAAGGAFFHWRNVKPFGLQSADQFRLDDPPALTSARYARDYNEVKQMGGANSTLRPQDRSDVARFYAVTSPVACGTRLRDSSASQQQTRSCRTRTPSRC